MNLSRIITTFALPSMLVLGGATVAVTASAQDAGRRPGVEARGGHGGGHGHRGARFGGDPEQRIAHMTERLGLDAAQQTALRRIFAESRTQREALANEALTVEQLRDRQRQLGEQTRERIQALLTPAQREAMGNRGERGPRGDRAGRDGQRGPRGGEQAGAEGRRGPRFGRGGPGGHGMFERLQLDDAQRAAIQRIRQEERAQFEAVGSRPLTVEQRQGIHRQLREANGRRIRDLLRPDQQQSFDAMRAEMQERLERRGGPRGAERAPSTPRQGI